MAFRLTDEQWITVKRRIDDLGGYEALDHVRIAIEAHLTSAFVHSDANAQIASAYIEAHKAAECFRDALLKLAKLESVEISNVCPSDPISVETANLDAASRAKFACHMQDYTENLRQELIMRTSSIASKKRGRPNDKAITILCTRILETAKHERWIVVDDRGRTSAALIHLMSGLMKCALAANLTGLQRDRRAFINAMGEARKEQKKAQSAQKALNMELDALCGPAPETGDRRANCLCSAPRKSD